jgi:hypothetical protein
VLPLQVLPSILDTTRGSGVVSPAARHEAGEPESRRIV